MKNLTAAIRKEVASLAQAKGRRRAGAFVAEGAKCVADTLAHFELRGLYALNTWAEQNPEAGATIVGREEMREMSSLVTLPEVLAVYSLPPAIKFSAEQCKNSLVLALDRVQDPGNLGTILRTADWMGVERILASTDTVDCFNPKAVQATMGAIARIKIVYADLAAMLAECKEADIPVYGTFLDGYNIYTSALTATGVIVMGNEGSGISPDVEKYVGRRLFIPSFPPGRPTSESLNVATATAITLAEFRRREFFG